MRPDGLTNGDLGFLRHRTKPLVRNTIRNLACAAATSKPPLRPELSRIERAIVVGAGPSLAKNRHLLAAAQKRGWAILCVNASLTAIAEHVDPDVCVVREQLAVGAGLLGLSDRTLLVAEIGAHEDVFKRAGAWFVPAYPRYFELVDALGIRPVLAGSAALTTAVSIALEAGAKEIALVGVDLAFARDGEGYAPQSQWQGFRHNGERIEGDGLMAMAGVAAAAGMAPAVTHDTATERVPAWDGGAPLRALDSWSDQARWLETMAMRAGSHVGLWNATEGGRAIAGWRARDLAAVLDTNAAPPSLAVGTPNADAIRRYLRQLAASADRLERIAREVLEPTDDGLGAIHQWHAGAPLVSSWAQREYLDAEQLPTAAQQLEAFEGGRISAAQAVRAMLAEVGV